MTTPTDRRVTFDLALFNDHLDHLEQVDGFKEIKMINFLILFKVFNLVKMFIVLGQSSLTS